MSWMCKEIQAELLIFKECLFFQNCRDAGDFPRGSDTRVRKWFRRKWLLPRFTSTGHCIILPYITTGSYLDLLPPVIALYTVIIVLPISCYIPQRSLYCALYCSRRSLPISQRILSFITALRINRW